MSEILEDPARLFDVRGKVAVVTGASGAFGSLAARVLAAAGARLVLAAGNVVELEATAAACRGAASNAEIAIAGRRPNTEADCEAIMDAGVARFGRLDILVVGSGLNDVSPIVDMSLERFENVMNGNVTSAWLLCRSFGKRAIAQGGGGKVVLMSSARGKLGHPAG
jgi:NAD(P)-dependent dehydrogenase (short-subunit alcohol dehydrogenase family)